MKIIKSFFIALSIYSKIPVPQFDWKEEEMKYSLCFFPIVGALIGLLIYGWTRAYGSFINGSDILYICVAVAIPLVITGGFHVDGFMDTMDALHSYQSREKKLEILKDPHIGAFSVICLAILGLIYMGAFSMIGGTYTNVVGDSSDLKIMCISFFLSRVLSALAATSFKSAKSEGMLHTFSSTAEGLSVKIILIAELVAGVVFMLFQSLIFGGAAIATMCIVTIFYFFKAKKEFGGITGDTEGYFVCILECATSVMLALMSMLF